MEEFFLVPKSSYCNENRRKYRADGFAIVLKKLGFLSEAPDKLRWLDYSGKSTLCTHTHTHTEATVSIPNPCTAETQNGFLWQRILNPQRRFGLWCFFKASLPCPVPWVKRGVYKNGGFGKPPRYRATGPSDVNVRHPPSETFTQGT